jgi:hypothetical protein
LPEKCQSQAEARALARALVSSKGSGFCQNFDLKPSLTVGLLLGQNRAEPFFGQSRFGLLILGDWNGGVFSKDDPRSIARTLLVNSSNPK